MKYKFDEKRYGVHLNMDKESMEDIIIRLCLAFSIPAFYKTVINQFLENRKTLHLGNYILTLKNYEQDQVYAFLSCSPSLKQHQKKFYYKELEGIISELKERGE